MKKTIIFGIAVLVLISFALAGDTLNRVIEIPAKEQISLGISSLNVSEMKCDRTDCYFTVKGVGIDRRLRIERRKCTELSRNLICREWKDYDEKELLILRDSKIKRTLTGMAQEIIVKAEMTETAKAEFIDIKSAGIK